METSTESGMKAPILILITTTLFACGDGSNAVDKASPASAAPPSTEAATTMGGVADARAARGIAGSVAGVAPAPSADFTGAMANQTRADAPAGGDPLQNVTVATSGAPAMVIRTGQAFIEVEKLDPAVLRIRQLAAQVGGYIANSSMSGGRDQIRQATLEIKIPSPKYDEAVSSLSAIGKVETVSSSAQDVGEEFVDITARVTNSRRLEERLLSLLANRTGKLDEVLRVERELARVREEIERYEGRLRYLGARVAMSTLTITAHEPAPILGSDPGQNPIAAALRRAWRNFVSLVAAVIASLGVLIPLGLVAAGAWFGYRRWRRSVTG
jgi:Domain of unknown function (DUF4349)